MISNIEREHIVALAYERAYKEAGLGNKILNTAAAGVIGTAGLTGYNQDTLDAIKTQNQQSNITMSNIKDVQGIIANREFKPGVGSKAVGMLNEGKKINDVVNYVHNSR